MPLELKNPDCQEPFHSVRQNAKRYTFVAEMFVHIFENLHSQRSESR